jgi:hypothetical protein
MFSLVDPTMDLRTYLINLRFEVRKQRSALKAKAPGKAVSCSLHHTVTLKTGGIEEKAVLTYAMAEVEDEQVKPAEYHHLELVDNTNYLYNPLTSLIEAAVEETNTKIDMFAMNLEVMYTDDIVESVSGFVERELLALKIDDGFTVKTTVVAGGISEITIMVA